MFMWPRFYQNPHEGMPHKNRTLNRVRFFCYNGSMSITSGLTPRQTQIAHLLSQGHNAQEIARRLDVKIGTIYKHTADITQRTGMHRVELACKVAKQNATQR